MQNLNKLIFIFISLSLSLTIHALSLTGSKSYWQCKAYDNQDKQWLTRSAYKQVAINLAFEQCRKNSHKPHSCKVAHEFCEMVIKGKVMRPKWQCTALDKLGRFWRSDIHASKNHALVGARTLCERHSIVPKTCYVRLMACKNFAS